jgi:hypothetical protein
MGEYEPNDSRNITLGNNHAPGEPPRTGPREGEARAQSHVPGEKGERAAPRLNLNGEPLDETTGLPRGNPQASQSTGGQTQSMGGQTQSMGGVSQSMGQSPGQSMGASGQPVQEPSASHRSGVGTEQLGETRQNASAPTQGDAGGAGWAADFSPDQAEAASGHSAQHRQDMPEADPEAERTKREQAAGQGKQEAPQGLGYGAEDGEEMGDAPDASERGYGGASERRMKKLDPDS